MRTRIALACIAAGGLAAPAAADAAERLAAVTADNTLVLLRSDAPGQVDYAVPLSGLAQGDRIVGLDKRPATNVLYGLGASSTIYTIELGSGQARAVGLTPFSPMLTGGSFGFDFNPTVDRIRVVSDAGQDLRLNPDTGATAAVDGMLAYASSEPGAAPSVVAAAYTNSVPGATTTTLYDIDAARDALVTQNPPNNGTLNSVGALGIDVTGPAGFDIAADGTALAALRRSGQTNPDLYSVNLATGAATAIGALASRSSSTATASSPVGPIAILGAVADDTQGPQVTASVASPQTASRLRSRPVSIDVACNEACAITVAARAAGKDAGSATGAIAATAGRISVPVTLNRGAKAALRRGDVRTIRLTVTATDSAGNAATSTRTVRVSR